MIHSIMAGPLPASGMTNCPSMPGAEEGFPGYGTFSFRNGKRSLLEEVGPNQHHRRAGGRVMDPNLGIFLLFHKKSELAFFFLSWNKVH